MCEVPCTLIGTSPAIRSLDEEITQASRSDAKVLLSGESGAGKEVTARLIHCRSARRRAPIVAINCAGMAESLLESELFGHVRGSFTGAYRDRPGMLEVANHGTILMDEIGEMTQRMQGLLLRFLDTGEIQRVGDDRRGVRLDVRIISATHRNLREAVAATAFREDLFYRLNVLHIHVPPLRERREDIPLLLEACLVEYAARHGVDAPPVSPEALQKLMEYRWPGNVRELRNVAERLVVRVRADTVQMQHLPPEIAQGREGGPVAPISEARGGSPADALFDRMQNERQTFWSVVYDPFMSRDLTREHVRQVVRKGLEQTRGSYTLLLQLFNIEPREYKRFLSFLRKHQCHMPFQHFRVASGRPPVLVPPAGSDHRTKTGAASSP